MSQQTMTQQTSKWQACKADIQLFMAAHQHTDSMPSAGQAWQGGTHQYETSCRPVEGMQCWEMLMGISIFQHTKQEAANSWYTAAHGSHHTSRTQRTQHWAGLQG